MVILTEYIVKHELKPLRRYFTIEDIRGLCNLDRVLEDIEKKKYEEFRIL